MKWKEQVKNRFSVKSDANKWSNIYTTNRPNVEALTFRSRRDYTLDYVVNNIAEDSLILDLGCGAGPVLKKLSKYKYSLVGVDYSHDMLEHARNNLGEQYKDIPLISSDCEHTPFTDNSFDCVICLGVISYAESIDGALNEIYRILKPGGTLILSYRNEFNSIILDPINFIKYILKLPFKKFIQENKTIGRSLPRSEVIGILDNISFTIREEKQMGFGNIAFNNKVLSDGNLAIKTNKILDKVLSLFKFKKLYRLLSDVHIIVLTKDL